MVFSSKIPDSALNSARSNHSTAVEKSSGDQLVYSDSDLNLSYTVPQSLNREEIGNADEQSLLCKEIVFHNSYPEYIINQDKIISDRLNMSSSIDNIESDIQSIEPKDDIAPSDSLNSNRNLTESQMHAKDISLNEINDNLDISTQISFRSSSKEILDKTSVELDALQNQNIQCNEVSDEPLENNGINLGNADDKIGNAEITQITLRSSTSQNIKCIPDAISLNSHRSISNLITSDSSFEKDAEIIPSDLKLQQLSIYNESEDPKSSSENVDVQDLFASLSVEKEQVDNYVEENREILNMNKIKNDEIYNLENRDENDVNLDASVKVICSTSESLPESTELTDEKKLNEKQEGNVQIDTKIEDCELSLNSENLIVQELSQVHAESHESVSNPMFLLAESLEDLSDSRNSHLEIQEQVLNSNLSQVEVTDDKENE